MYGRRVLAVAAAALVVMAVAVLVRPADPAVPPPFGVERSSAEPRPAGATEAATDPTEAATEPTEAATDPTEEPTPRFTAQPRTTRLVVRSFDPARLGAVTTGAELTLDGRGGVIGAVSPGGRYVALVHSTGSRETDILVYDTERRAEPRAVATVPEGLLGMWFSLDGGHVFWAGLGGTEAHLSGVELDGDGGVARTLPGVSLPPRLVLSDLAPLDGGRVGVYGHDAGSRAQSGIGARGADVGPVRLLVADVAAGRLVLDSTLPTADGATPLDGALDLRHLRAGVAWDVPRNRAYVAHADRDAVLVVDLGTGNVLDELAVAGEEGEEGGAGDALADDPEASRWRGATLSGDGSVLVVHGTATAPLRPGRDAQELQHADLPLLVADLESSTVLRSASVRGHVAAVADDGSTFAVAVDDPDTEQGRALWLYDRDLTPRWAVDLADAVELRFSPGGGQLLILRSAGGFSSHGGALLEALDAGDGSLAGSVEFAGGWWVTDLDAGVVVEIHEP